MERSNRFAAGRTQRSADRLGRRCASRDGKLTLVTLVAIIAMAVIIGFVGNAGYVVTEKMHTQNAADAVAFSSAQWMARGMNAVTATNHLLGEITGLVVAIEALGGPEADLGMEAYPAPVRITDNINQNFVSLAKINGLPVYGAQAAGRADEMILKALVNNLISRKDAKHRAWATIYDSKLALKKSTAKRLIVKSIANAGLWVPPPWGWISAIAAYAVHIKMNAELIEIGIEYVYLEGLEKLVTLPVISKLKRDVIEAKLVPAIAAHGDYLAGRPSLIGGKRPPAESSVVTYSIQQSLEHLGKVYEVKAAIYPMEITPPPVSIPGIGQLQKLRLPIAPEAPPSMAGTPKNKVLPQWGDDKIAISEKGDPVAEIKKKMAENRKRTEGRIAEVKQEIKFLEDLFNDVQDLKEQTGVTQDERQAFQKEQGEISADIVDKKKILADREDDLKKIKDQEKQVAQAEAELNKIPDISGNLSAKDSHLALSGILPSGTTGGVREVGMTQSEERDTQWVRASYPYVDGFRAPIMAMFREHLEICEAAKHYQKWTDRYTLIKSWQFRSGYRFRRKDDENGEWSRDKSQQPLTMYLMVEKFDPNKAAGLPKPGAKRGPKGFEVWTKDTIEGKEMAEKMFTIVGMTHREITPFFSPKLFPVPTDRGMTTFAQAIYYNSNEQKPGQAGKTEKTQAKIAWDTLAWAPDTTVPEWGNELSKSDARWPWDLFTSSAVWRGNAKVKLNWQAKLMPVTRSRLKPAAAAAVAKSPDMAADIAIAVPEKVFDIMVTH